MSDTEQEYWKLVNKFAEETLSRYEGVDELNQVFARGPFAGWSEQQVKGMAEKMVSSNKNFPLWKQKE